MKNLFAGRALLPEGWARDVRVSVGEDGRIAAVEVGVEAQLSDELLAERILLPAPANLHSHAFQRAMAGMTEVRGPGEKDSFWTWRKLMYRFLGALTPEDVEAVAALVQVEMAEAGYAALVEFHYLHHQSGGERYDDVAEMAGRIAAAAAQTGIGLTLLPVLYMQSGCDGRVLVGGQLRFASRDFDEFTQLVEGAAAAVGALGADAGMGVAPHSLRAVPLEMVGEAARLRPDDPVHIHAAEQIAEIDEVTAAHGKPPVALLLDQAGFGPRWCVIHATHMRPGEVQGLARSGAVAGLCPITESNLGDGIFGGPGFREAGGMFGIGSDSNINISLAGELRTLEYSQRLGARARAVMAGPGSTGRVLFEGAVAGGARASGRNSGAIEVGRLADLMALDGGNLALTGLDGDMALDGWIFAGGANGAVSDVWSAGRRLVSGGHHYAREAVEARYRAVLARLRETA